MDTITTHDSLPTTDSTSAIAGDSATVEVTRHATHECGDLGWPEPCRWLDCDDGWEAEQASSSWGTALSPWLWGIVNNIPCHVSKVATTSRMVTLAAVLTVS